MTRHTTKAGLLEDIRVQRSRLMKNLDILDAEQMTQTGVVGEWSVKDMLAHLIDWEQRFIGWYRAGVRGETPETPAPGLNWRQLDILNQQIYEKHKDRLLADVLAEFDASYEEILDLVNGMSEQELFTPGQYAWVGDGILADWVAANTSNHYNWAKTCIRKWMKQEAL